MKKGYINNAEFYSLLKEYLSKDKESKQSKKSIKILNEIGNKVLLIAQMVAMRPNFVNYDNNLKGDMVSDAVYAMVKYIDRYNVEQTNPFAFFSQFAFNAFIQNINKFKKLRSRYVSLDYIENMSSDIDNKDYISYE